MNKSPCHPNGRLRACRVARWRRRRWRLPTGGQGKEVVGDNSPSARLSARLSRGKWGTDKDIGRRTQERKSSLWSHLWTQADGCRKVSDGIDDVEVGVAHAARGYLDAYLPVPRLGNG